MATADTIKQYFVNILQRDPTAAETAYWVATVDSSALTLTQVRDSLAGSGEAVTYVDQIVRIYQAAFGRKPDVTGINGWTDELRADATALSKIAAGFVNSTEWKNRYGDNTVNDAVLQSLYVNVLGRVGSAAEIQAWKATGDSMSQILIKFSNSAEFQAKSASAVMALKQAAGDVATSALNTVFTGSGALFDPAAGTGQTYTLTTAIDNLTGTAGNDTFIGDAATSSLADQLNGGAGTDTLKLFGAAAEPTHTNIEIIELSGNTAGFDVSDNVSVTNLNLIDPTTGQIYTIANGQKVSVSTVAAGEVVDFAGNSVTGLDLTVSGFGTAAANATIDLNSTAQTSLTLTSGAVTSGVAITNTGGKLDTITVKGTTAIDITHALTTVKTIDASATTGGIDVEGVGASDLTFTGGKGNDSINLAGTITKADKIDGGEGTDTLKLTQAGVTIVEGLSATDKATLNTNLANLEILEVTDALTSNIDASRFDGINQYILAAGLNNGGTSTLSNVASGVAVSIGDAAGTATDILAISIKDATLAGNNSDAVTINLTDAAGGGASDAGVVNLVGVDLLSINTTQAAGGTTTGHVLDIANTSTALDKVTVTGNTALDISTVALVNSIAEVDASGMTLSAATANGLKVSIATGGTNGVKITGSGGIDTIVGGDAADVIIGGAGADIITGGAGNDVLTGGDGADTFIFGATAVANGADTIKDFKAGAASDVLNTAAFTGGTTGAANNLTLTTSSANVTLLDNNAFVLNTAANITGKDYGGADFAELFGAGNGQFNTTVGAAAQSVVVVKGADVSHVYYVDASLAGVNTNVEAADVTLVGTLTVDGTFATANFA